MSTLGLGGMLPGVSEVISFAAETLLDKGKDLYSDRVKPHLRSNPTTWDETHRKAAKAAIKDLKANAFQTIDRNLVKLRDAKNKVEPAIKAFQAAMSSAVPGGGAPPAAVLEARMKKAQEALRAVAEAEYYVDKVMNLVKVNGKALEDVVKNLEPLKVSIQRTQGDLATSIKADL